ncbi:hypothetical protein ACIQXW_17730 [Lysinibacillus sp. NPDC097162]|uniref:hypothetical protein n=1 Tax=Lysinibacillus sp. NPDC097162 TaxID=3364140 RepID=UPI003807EE2C
MKKYKYFATTVLTLALFLAGCNSSEKEEKALEQNKEETIEAVTDEKAAEQIIQEIPEPYTKALIAINDQRWDLANTYLDLVISDFPDSEYILPTKIIQGGMQVNEYLGAVDLSEILISGSDLDSPLYDTNDLETLRRHMELVKDILNKSLEEQEATFSYIVQTFKTDQDYSEHYKDINQFSMNENYFDDLSFFESVGYPVPTDAEIEKFLNAKYNFNVQFLLNGLTEKTEHLNYNYLLVFYNAGIILLENYPELSNDIFNLILDLTMNDPYNEFRISIEEFMAES